MLQNLWERFVWVIGGNEVEPFLPVWQLVLRTVVIYVVALLIIRVGKRRFMGSYTTFDILLGFVVGSILSRTITGSVQLIDMVFIVGTLVLLHWIIATASFYSERFSHLVKNSPRKLVIDGELQKDAMQKSKIGEKDLMQALREEANIETIDDVKNAYIERDGNITVIPKKNEPKIIEVETEKGVQTIRIVLE